MDKDMKLHLLSITIISVLVLFGTLCYWFPVLFGGVLIAVGLGLLYLLIYTELEDRI